ncbi:MAG: hypothetical protein N2037_05200 [Acidimicrobiales bacterium]|nr:hypothetical protein [Acidimicrobiales bacterium]
MVVDEVELVVELELVELELVDEEVDELVLDEDVDDGLDVVVLLDVDEVVELAVELDVVELDEDVVTPIVVAGVDSLPPPRNARITSTTANSTITMISAMISPLRLRSGG